MHRTVIGLPAGTVVASVDEGGGEMAPRIMAHIGDTLTLVLAPDTADELADALIGALAALADRPVITK